MIAESGYKKTPQRRGFGIAWNQLLGTGTNDFDFYAAVLGSTGGSLVVSDRLFLAFAFSVDAARVNALGYQVALYRFGAAYGQLLVVRTRARRIREALARRRDQADQLRMTRVIRPPLRPSRPSFSASGCVST